MKRVKRGISKDNRGLTLVELLCTVAIFSFVMATVGSLLVVSARTYRGGSAETAIQQESQFAANFIENLIVDVTESVSYSYYDPTLGGFQTAVSEAAALAAGAGADQDRRLEMVNGTTERHEIIYRAATREIVYRHFTSGGGWSAENLVAENVTAFGADVSSFAQSHNVVLQIAMEHDTKAYNMTYNITSRNGNVNTTSSLPTNWAYITADSLLILEPCQTYELAVSVSASSGVSTGYTFTLSENSSSLTTATVSSDKIAIHLDKDEVGNSMGIMYLTIQTNAYNDAGTAPLATKVVAIRVRRVDDIGVTKIKDDAMADDYAAGTTYTVSAVTSGRFFAQELGNVSDMDYKNPYFVQWSWDFTIAGTSANANTYFDFTSNEDVDNPSLQLELKQDMPANSKLEITALAKHPEGKISGTKYNKSGDKYGEVKKTIVLENTGVAPSPLGTPVNIRRGQDFHFSSVESSTLTSLDSAFRDSHKQGDNGADYHWYFRFRMINDDGSFGPWTAYYRTDEGGFVKKLNAQETMCLLPDKQYQIEYIKAITNHTAGKLYWPCEPALLAAGTGFDGYTAGWGSEPVTPEAEYRYTYTVDKVQPYFKENTAYGIAEGALYAGTETAPLLVYAGGGINMDLELNASALEFSHFQNKFKVRIEKWDDTTSSWQSATENGWSLQTGASIKIANVQTWATGKYRLKLYIEDYVAKQIGGVITGSVCTDLAPQDYEYWDETTGEGIIYLQFNP